MAKLRSYVGEVTYPGRIDEFDLTAEDTVQGRDLLVRHLSGGEKWLSIRIRETVESASGQARVIGKKTKD
jgi:hypothetical protein